MSFDFPNTPTVNQTVIAPNGALFVWDGSKWIAGTGPTPAPGSLYLPLAGGTVAGLLVANANLTVHGTIDLDYTAAYTLSGELANVYIGAIALTQPYTNQIFQRDTRTGGLFGTGTGRIILAVNPTQPITMLQHRLRDAGSPGVVVQDWSSSVPPIFAGSQTVYLTAPAGFRKYLVDLRANHDDTSIVSTTQPVMIGELFAFAGQSLAEDFVTTAASGDPATISSLLTISPWGYHFAAYASNGGAYPPVPDGPDVNYPPTAFLAPTDTGPIRSTFCVEFANRMVALTGVPCGIIGYAVGGTSIASWLPGYTGPNPGHWDKLVNVLTLAGGIFGAFLWCQGHYESKNGNTAANYRSQLDLLFQNLNAQFPDANFKSVIGTIPSVVSYGSGPAFIVMVRNTAKAFAAADISRAYVDGLDAVTYEGVHPSQAGNITFARHWYRAAAKLLLGGSLRGDKGPVITGGSRAYGSRDITLLVTQTNGGTSWVGTGSPADQFQVFLAGTTTNVPLDATTPIDLSNPGRIILRIATPPVSQSQPLDVWYRRSPDNVAQNTDGIYDNVTDADGLTQGRQLWDNAAAIVVTGPTITITVNNILDLGVGVLVPVSGAFSPGPPGGLDYSIDGGNTWLPANATLTPTTFSFAITAGIAYSGLYRVLVRDNLAFSNAGSSNAFLVQTTAPPPPPLLSNPLFAFDAQSARGTLYQDSSLSVQAAIGDFVYGVKDSSPNAVNFIQPTAGQAPRLEGNIKNGLPGLRFTAASLTYLRQASGTIGETLRMSSGYVIMVAFTPLTLPTSTAVAQDVVDFGNSTTNSSKARGLQQLSTGALRTSRNPDAATSVNAATNPVTAGTLVKSVARYDASGAIIKIKVDGVAGEGNASTNGLVYSVTWPEAARIGCSEDGVRQFYLDGWIHEIRVWNTNATDTDRDNLLAYMANRWGATVIIAAVDVAPINDEDFEPRRMIDILMPKDVSA